MGGGSSGCIAVVYKYFSDDLLYEKENEKTRYDRHA